MTDKEVLQKSIEIAIENGYKLPSVFDMGEPYDSDRFQIFKGYFSHNFAKAFWGEEEITTSKHIHTSETGNMSASEIFQQKIYLHHLQQMVLEDNPIDYLRKFV